MASANSSAVVKPAFIEVTRSGARAPMWLLVSSIIGVCKDHDAPGEHSVIWLSTGLNLDVDETVAALMARIQAS